MNDPNENEKKTNEEDWLQQLLSRPLYSFDASRITCYPRPQLDGFFVLVIEAKWQKYQGAPAVDSEPLTFEIPARLLYEALQSITKQLQLDVPNQVLDKLDQILSLLEKKSL